MTVTNNFVKAKSTLKPKQSEKKYDGFKDFQAVLAEAEEAWQNGEAYNITLNLRHNTYEVAFNYYFNNLRDNFSEVIILETADGDKENSFTLRRYDDGELLISIKICNGFPKEKKPRKEAKNTSSNSKNNQMQVTEKRPAIKGSAPVGNEAFNNDSLLRLEFKIVGSHWVAKCFPKPKPNELTKLLNTKYNANFAQANARASLKLYYGNTIEVYYDTSKGTWQIEEVYFSNIKA